MKIKYLLLYILVYFVVDFTTGFRWSFQYWLSLNGPLVMAIQYSLSGLIFAYLIYKRNIRERWLFLITAAYGFLIEVVIIKNPMFTSGPQLAILATFLTLVFYPMIVFIPKWIVNKEIKRNLKKVISMTAVWFLIAIVTYLNYH